MIIRFDHAFIIYIIILLASLTLEPVNLIYYFHTKIGSTVHIHVDMQGLHMVYYIYYTSSIVHEL